MPLATTEQLKQIWEMVDEWCKSCPSISIFHDSKRITRVSIAEYIANTKFSATIYEFAANKENKCQ